MRVIPVSGGMYIMREFQGIFSEDSYACQLLPEAVSTVTATLLLHVQTYGYADSLRLLWPSR